MSPIGVVLVLLSLCVKTQGLPLPYAKEHLPQCVDEEAVKGDYRGEMDGSGLAILSSANGKGTIRLSEPGALSGINHKYRLPTNYSIVQGVLYDHREDWEYPAKVNLISWETAGGDNLATIAADNLTAYEDREVTLSFIPLCFESRRGLLYAGPSFILEKMDIIYPIPCVYRATSLGRPVKCFKGISTGVEIDKSLSEDSTIEIRSLSPPFMSSWYRIYRNNRWGTHSVRGVGAFQGVDTQADDSKGFFVGTMHISKDNGPVILEGYVTIRTGGATDPEGVFRLATWESVQQYNAEVLRTTAVVQDNLPLVSKWTCTTDNGNNYRFAQLDCKVCNSASAEVQQTFYHVYPFGVWSQLINWPCDTPSCKLTELGAVNIMNVSDYNQDSMVRITRHIAANGEAVMDFEAYGSPPEKGFYEGPTKLID